MDKLCAIRIIGDMQLTGDILYKDENKKFADFHLTKEEAERIYLFLKACLEK